MPHRHRGHRIIQDYIVSKNVSKGHNLIMLDIELAAIDLQARFELDERKKLFKI